MYSTCVSALDFWFLDLIASELAAFHGQLCFSGAFAFWQKPGNFAIHTHDTFCEDKYPMNILAGQDALHSSLLLIIP